MPIYEYQCDECGHVFELMKKRSEREPAACADCGAAHPRRAISRTGFQLKGDGWYVTDYKSGISGSEKKKTEAETEAKSSDDAGSNKPDSPTKTESLEPAPAAEKSVA